MSETNTVDRPEEEPPDRPRSGSPIKAFIEAANQPNPTPVSRLTDLLRKKGVWRDDAPDGRRLVLDPDRRNAIQPQEDRGLTGPVNTDWRRSDTKLTRAILADRNTGMTQAEIAAKRGIHVQTVRRHLAIAGSPRRQPLTEAQIDEARRYRAEGWTLRDLGHRYGVAHTTVARALKAADEGQSEPE